MLHFSRFFRLILLNFLPFVSDFQHGLITVYVHLWQSGEYIYAHPSSCLSMCGLPRVGDLLGNTSTLVRIHFSAACAPCDERSRVWAQTGGIHVDTVEHL